MQIIEFMYIYYPVLKWFTNYFIVNVFIKYVSLAKKKVARLVDFVADIFPLVFQLDFLR
jgi:hypothetical protein